MYMYTYVAYCTYTFSCFDSLPYGSTACCILPLATAPGNEFLQPGVNIRSSPTLLRPPPGTWVKRIQPDSAVKNKLWWVRPHVAIQNSPGK